MYYPLLFEPIYKQMIWGGNRLSELFGRELPFPLVGESWDISCRQDEMGTVRNGRLRGTDFSQLVGIDPAGYLGKSLHTGEFPLLVKLIDANDNLSVQVHPGTEHECGFAGRTAGAKAKNEVWYIIHAEQGARLNIGLVPGVKKEQFAHALQSGELEKYLNFVCVKKGDVINIPAGTVHAIGVGLILAEIQQNSDSTYRVYDYGRVDASGKPRQLHVDEALETIDFSARGGVIKGEVSDVPGGKIVFYCATKHYALYEYLVDTRISENSDPERFYIFTCVEGTCEIRASGYCTTVVAGDSVFIPAALGAYDIVGKCKLLKSFVPE